MSHSLTCLECSSTFTAPTAAAGAPVACPRCGATRVVAEERGAGKQPKPAAVRAPLTDDDVLAFIGSPPVRHAPPKK